MKVALISEQVQSDIRAAQRCYSLIAEGLYCLYVEYILPVPLQLIRHRKDDEGEPDTGEGDDVRRSEAFTEVENRQE